jgi:hypothetical protein
MYARSFLVSCYFAVRGVICAASNIKFLVNLIVKDLVGSSVDIILGLLFVFLALQPIVVVFSQPSSGL